jgi:hypothetical protein
VTECANRSTTNHTRGAHIMIKASQNSRCAATLNNSPMASCTAAATFMSPKQKGDKKVTRPERAYSSTSQHTRDVHIMIKAPQNSRCAATLHNSTMAVSTAAVTYLSPNQKGDKKVTSAKTRIPQHNKLYQRCAHHDKSISSQQMCR